MNVLFLCHRVPFPPNRGDRIATHRRLLHLAARHRVRCLTFTGEPNDAESVRELEKVGIEVVTAPFHERARRIAALPWIVTSAPLTLRCFASRRLAAAARAALREGFDLAVAYSSCMAQFVEHAPVPRVMEFGDLDSEKWHQYAAEAKAPQRWVYAREARTLLAYETRVARSFEVSLVVSPAEADTFEARTGVRPEVVGNGVDLERFRPGPASARIPGLVVFTGMMNYRPNVEGCVRFARRVLPRIRQSVPAARFRIVGANPVAEVRALAGGAVEVTGTVPETATHLREASVAVAPLRLGRGLQNKVLEAMASAAPVVASPNASAGIDAVPEEHFLLADTDEETAAAVLRCLSDPAFAGALGARGRSRMEERYRWERALADYDAALALACERRARGAR